MIAAAGVLMAGVYWWQRQPARTARTATRSLPDSYVPVIDGGAMRWGRGSREALDVLCLVEGGIAVVGRETALELSFTELRGVFRHEVFDSIRFDLYLEREGRWGWLSLYLRPSDAPTLVKLLRRARPGLPLGDAAEVAIYSAHLADQSLHGELAIGTEVIIHVVGRLVVVTQGDVVLAKLTASGIRRVVAMEQPGSRGLVRLYSATETTLFLSEQYRALAQHLADQAHAPLDWVTLSDRKNK